jgi:hypothetical protein
VTEDLISAIVSVLEAVNPMPALVFDIESIKGLMNFCAMLLSGYLVFCALYESKILPEKQSRILAICFALMGGLYSQGQLMLLAAAQYALFARALDGFLCGHAFGEIARRARGRMFSVPPVVLIFQPFWQIWTLASLVLLWRSFLRFFRELPALQTRPGACVIAVVLCMSGILAVPALASNGAKVLFLALFPTSALVGGIVGWHRTA